MLGYFAWAFGGGLGDEQTELGTSHLLSLPLRFVLLLLTLNGDRLVTQNMPGSVVPPDKVLALHLRPFLNQGLSEAGDHDVGIGAIGGTEVGLGEEVDGDLGGEVCNESEE